MKNDKVGDPLCQGQDEIINHTPLSPCYKPYYSTGGYSGYHQDVLPSEGSNHRDMARASANKLRHPPSPCQSKHKTVAQSIPPSLLSPSMQSGWPLSDYKIFECEWDLPNVFPSLSSAFPGQTKFLTEVVDVKEVLFNTLTLTRSDECVKASTCGEYVGEIYGVEGIRLLSHIVSAFGSEDGESSDPDMLIIIRPSSLYVRLRPSIGHLWDLLLWVCLTFRRPVPGNVCLSTSKIDGSKVVLQELSQLEEPESTSCWLSLFETAVIASDPRIQSQAGFFLDLNFGMMLQLAAVEYPVMVDSGLVLIGCSTALIPIKEVDHQSILWHLETATHNSQLQTMELTAVRGEWMRKTELKDLQSRRVFLGWCSEAMILLGTGKLNSTMQWSNAKPKRTTWSLTGINLQLSATTVSPLQVGGSLGLTFEREVTTLPFDTNDGYLECLKSSMAEQVFLYDVSESRAWFVPLIAVLHQMLLAYYERIPAEFRKGTIPLAQRPYTGADSSFRCLQGSGSVVVEGSGKDRLTVRDLILGFSANVAKAGLHPAGRSEIYGYEFMDIVTDSPRSELKATSVEKEASAWTSLLSHVKCLFCSQLGDVIVDRKSYGRQLLCNRLPVGLDWLAASMHSLDTLNTRQGGKPTGIVRLLSSEHYWSMTGSPFQDCNHSNASQTSCWDTGALLQEVKRGRLPTEEDEEMNDVRNGAVVFGRGKRTVCRISGSDQKAKKPVPGEITEPSVRLSTLKAISRKHRDSSMSLSSGTVTEE